MPSMDVFGVVFPFDCIIIIIISLFQEDNIFGTNASLTYGPRLPVSVSDSCLS